MPTYAKSFKSGAIEHRRKFGERLCSFASRSERLYLTNQLQDAEVDLIAKATLVELDDTGVSASAVSVERSNARHQVLLKMRSLAKPAVTVVLNLLVADHFNPPTSPVSIRLKCLF